jgi:hypothetical protein
MFPAFGVCMSLALIFSLLAAAPSGGSPCAPAPERGLAIVIQVARFELALCEHGATLAVYPVTIGDPVDHRTPIGRFKALRIEVDPTWYPPRMAYWTSQREPMGPGPANPMGRLKLPIGGDIAVHGSMEHARLGLAASHGCVRLSNEDAFALARVIVERRVAGLLPKFDGAVASATPSPLVIRLRSGVPVITHYDPLERRGDSLVVHGDVYREGVAAAVLDSLHAAGFDTVAVRRGLAAQRGIRDSVPPRVVLVRAPAP